MKKSILILCACAALAGCSDDDLVVNRPATPGDEVQFGASAYMPSGNGTRTEYGEVVGNKIELRWVKDDKLDIACPQAVAGRRKAAYEIMETTIVGGTEGKLDTVSATGLQKLGAFGIQWGEPGVHHFYASYPSSESFDKDERGKIGLDAEGLNGYLPVNQNPKRVDSIKVDDKTNYILEPDMRYAFMVAHESVDSRVAGDNGVSLHFKPLVTALQFELTAPDIINNTGASTELTITAVSLHSASEQNICGSFQYKFQGDAMTDKNTATGYSRITQTISSEVKLNAGTGNKMDVTFFVLPTADLTKGDLRLQVFYTYNGSPYVKTLQIGKELKARKKYYFRNVKLPKIDANVQGSTWFSALDPNVYISQLSIPVAGNTFSNYYSGADSAYYQEQTLNYLQLWNKGVRGFEFSTAHGKTNFDNSTSGTLENNRFVCNGKAMNVTSNGKAITFGNAFRALTTALAKDSNECLIVICNYKTYAKSDTQMTGNDCQQYVKDLEAWLTANDTIKKRLVKLTPNSTVGDLRGKIAIIIRPGEDAYSLIATSSIKVTNTNLTLVQDWGTSVDKWNTRFGDSYMCEGAFNTPNKTKIEDYLWATGSGSDPQGEYSHSSYGPDFAAGYPTTNSFSFDHKTNADGQTVHVQEWARIIPSGSFATKAFYSGLSANHTTGFLQWGHDTYLWLKWPESYSQKQDMIKETVTASMATKGGSTVNKLFINSLCGYYPVKELPASYYPYNTSYTYKCLGSHNVTDHSPSFSLDNAGAGGNYVTCAYDLNKWFYQYLTELNKENGVLKQGPVGLVMLNHIGTTAGGSDDKSLDLVNWIMMNNFKFPLATKPKKTTGGTGIGGGTSTGNGGAN